MKTTNQELEQLKQEIKELEAKKAMAIKGGNCCGPGKSGSELQ